MPDHQDAPLIAYNDLPQFADIWIYNADVTARATVDYDGDGVFETVLGVPDADAPGATNRGHVYVLTRLTYDADPASTNLTILDPPRDGGNPFFLDWSATRFTFPAGFRGGTALSGGDINNDGLEDLIFAARGGAGNAGSTYVYLNNGSPLPNEVALDNPDGTTFFRLDGSFAFGASGGMSLAVGDFNDDDFDDIAIGTPGAASSAGAIQFFFGHAGPFSPVINLGTAPAGQVKTITGTASGDGLGGALAALDFNGDDVDDLAATAELADSLNGANSGFSHVFFGYSEFDTGGPATPAAINGTNGVSIAGPSANANFGWSMGGGKSLDVDGDGTDDLIVGAPPLNNFSGGAFLIFGSSTRTVPLINTATAGAADVVFFNGTGANNSGGVAVALTDINVDGFADVMVSSPDTDVAGNLDVGALAFFYGSTGPFAPVLQLNEVNGQNGFIIQGGIAFSRFGIDGSYLGDTNGDGIPDLAIGSSGNDTAFIFRGSGPDHAVTRIGSAADQTIFGSPFADTLEGRGGNDFFDTFGGGDTVRGEEGDDAAIILPGDRFIGGDGTDTAYLFPGQVVGGVVNLTPDTESTEIWDLGLIYRPRFLPRLSVGAEFYNIVVDEAIAEIGSNSLLTILAADLPLDVDALLNGASVANGNLRFFPGGGVMDVRGGAGNDGALWGNFSRFAPGSSFDGGGGADSIAFRGNYFGANALQFQSNSFPNVEVMVFLSGLDDDFGGPVVAGGYDYEASLGNFAGTLDIVARLGIGEDADVDASAVQDATLRFFGGAGNDSYVGGGLFDLWYGGAGADFGDIGAGPGVYVYRSLLDSVTGAVDRINVRTGNTIDLSFLDAILSTPENDAFTIIGGNAFGSPVGGELRFFNTSGNIWRIEVNVDAALTPDLIFDVELFAPDFTGVFVG